MTWSNRIWQDPAQTISAFNTLPLFTCLVSCSPPIPGPTCGVPQAWITEHLRSKFKLFFLQQSWLTKTDYLLPRARSTSRWSMTTSTRPKIKWWPSARESATCWWRRPTRTGGRWGRRRARRLFMCQHSMLRKCVGHSCPHRSPP